MAILMRLYDLNAPIKMIWRAKTSNQHSTALGIWPNPSSSVSISEFDRGCSCIVTDMLSISSEGSLYMRFSTQATSLLVVFLYTKPPHENLKGGLQCSLFSQPCGCHSNSFHCTNFGSFCA
jgi:hypothetical protein